MDTKTGQNKKKPQYEKQGTVSLQNNQKPINNMAIVSLYLSVITLNVNGLNCSMKRHRMNGLKK